MIQNFISFIRSFFFNKTKILFAFVFCFLISYFFINSTISLLDKSLTLMNSFKIIEVENECSFDLEALKIFQEFIEKSLKKGK